MEAKIRKIGSHFEFLEILLNRVDQGNAWGAQEAKDLKRILKTKCQGLLMTNSGHRFFCSGGNLSEQKDSTKAASLKVQKEIRETLVQLASLEVPTVAVVRGDVFGGGVELLSAFDYVIAAPHVQLGFYQRKLGVTFGWGGGKRLLERLSFKKMKQLSLATKVLNAYEAQRIGLIDAVVPESLLETRAHQWLCTVAQYSDPSFQALRKWSPATETKVFESLWFNNQHKEYLKKF